MTLDKKREIYPTSLDKKRRFYLVVMNKMCIFAEKYNKTMAISKEIFRNIIREGQEEIINVELYDRPIDFEENGRYVFVQMRQAHCNY